MGLDKSVALVTDGRFSGTSGGSCIGHLSTEAMVKGPVAVLYDGDIIDLDIPARRLDVDLGDREIEKRKISWSPPTSRKSPTAGWAISPNTSPAPTKELTSNKAESKKPVSRDSTLEENGRVKLEGVLGCWKAQAKILYFFFPNTGFTPFTPNPIINRLVELMIYIHQPQ
jgi:hypothetical protein